MEQGKWYAPHGEEREPNRLLKYALFVLVGVSFAATAIVLMALGQAARAKGLQGMGIWESLLWALLAAVITGVIGAIIWFVHKAVILRK